MGDETGTSSGKEGGFPGPASTRHEKPIIEGAVVSRDAAPEPRSDGDQGAAKRAEAATAAAARDDPIDTGSDGAPPRRAGAALWPIAAAIVIGAGLAVGGAFLLRNFGTGAERLAHLSTREAQLAARVAALETKPDAGKDLAGTLAAQEKRIGLAAAAAREALATAKSALAATAANKGSHAAATPPRDVDLTPLRTQIADLDRRLGEFDRRLAKLAAPAPPKTDVRLPEDKAVPSPRADNAEAIAIIAAILAGKVERGAAYAPELSALANLGVDKDKRAALAPTAATGVATRADLAAQFAALSKDLLATQPVRKAEGSFFDRLMRNAGRLVRKVGDTTGNGLPARIARIDAALRGGSVEAALAQWDELPAAAKEKSKAFAAAAKARVDAAAAARAIEAEAVAMLGKPKS